MTLYELLNSSEVQGNVLISVWDTREELKQLRFSEYEDVSCADIPDDIEDAEVRYLFCDKDGCLNIEVRLTSDEI